MCGVGPDQAAGGWIRMQDAAGCGGGRPDPADAATGGNGWPDPTACGRIPVAGGQIQRRAAGSRRCAWSKRECRHRRAAAAVAACGWARQARGWSRWARQQGFFFLTEAAWLKDPNVRLHKEYCSSATKSRKLTDYRVPRLIENT